VSDVASHINDHIKQQDNFMRMLAIQKSLACPVGPRILVPGRVFIKEGQLKKVSAVTLSVFCVYIRVVVDHWSTCERTCDHIGLCSVL